MWAVVSRGVAELQQRMGRDFACATCRPATPRARDRDNRDDERYRAGGQRHLPAQNRVSHVTLACNLNGVPMSLDSSRLLGAALIGASLAGCAGVANRKS